MNAEYFPFNYTGGGVQRPEGERPQQSLMVPKQWLRTKHNREDSEILILRTEAKAQGTMRTTLGIPIEVPLRDTEGPGTPVFKGLTTQWGNDSEMLAVGINTALQLRPGFQSQQPHWVASLWASFCSHYWCTQNSSSLASRAEERGTLAWIGMMQAGIHPHIPNMRLWI